MKTKIKSALVFLLTLSFILNGQLKNCSAKDPVKDSTEMKTLPWFVEKFKVTGGFFVPLSNTKIHADIKGGAAGTEIDFERDLGYNNSQLTFLSNFQWRISPRSRANFNYYNIPRNSSHTLDKDIIFNGQTYPANSTISSFFNTAIYQISYGYAVFSKPDWELGVLIGAHIVGGKAGLSAVNNTGEVSHSTDFGFTAPLPDLGIWGGYAFSKRFGVNLDIDYLSATIGDIKGSIFAYNLLFIYRLVKKLDLSLGYSGLNFNLDVTKPNAMGNFKWSYNGPYLGATYSFGRKSWK